jgi:hypothetical protein
MTIYEYKVVEDTDAKTMSDRVNELIGQGWQPKDALIVVSGDTVMYRKFIQVMYR